MKNKWWRVWIWAFAALLFATGFVAAHPHPEARSYAVAHQSRVCDTYKYFTDSLVENYGEQLVDALKKPDCGRYEVWKSSETGSWTVLEVMPDNVETCVLGTGVVDLHAPDESMQRNAYTERGI